MGIRDTIMTRMTTLRAREVDVGGEKIFVRPLSLADVSRVQQAFSAGDHTGAMAATIIGGVCDSEGKPVFTSVDADMIRDWPGDYATELAIAVNSTTPTEAQAAGN
jgi:hypothetical protein